MFRNGLGPSGATEQGSEPGGPPWQRAGAAGAGGSNGLLLGSSAAGLPYRLSEVSTRSSISRERVQAEPPDQGPLRRPPRRASPRAADSDDSGGAGVGFRGGSSSPSDEDASSGGPEGSGPLSSIQLLGDFARRASDLLGSASSLFAAGAEGAESWRRGSRHDRHDEDEDDDDEDSGSGLSDVSENFNARGDSRRLRDRGRGDEDEESHGPAESADYAATLRRASVSLLEGLWPGSTSAADAAGPDEATGSMVDGRSGAAASSSSAAASSSQLPSRAAAAAGTATGTAIGVDFEELRAEVSRPFQKLLSEIPDFLNGGGNFLIALTPRSQEEVESVAPENLRSPLLSAVARSRLIGRVLSCCEAVVAELSPEESQLWDVFLHNDADLRGSLHARGEGLRALLSRLSTSSDRINGWADAIGGWADDNGDIDFADLLDWFAGERQKNHISIWALQSSSLRSSFSQLLTGTPAAQPAQMQRERIAEVRNRCASFASPKLAAVASSCQRTLVLTSWCQCERRLLELVAPATEAAAAGEPQRGPPSGAVSALLAVLRGINAELAPTERVLWELLGTKDADFDGNLDKSEVLAAVGELLVYSIERELGTPEAEFEELQRLRADCRRRSVETLFEENKRGITLPDILRWWWDMTEEYRIAAGLSVPTALLRRSLHRRPEEMFRDKLPKIAANPPAAKLALRGHARVFAELRALAVSRAIENLHGCSSPTDTWTTTSVTSEMTGETESNGKDKDEEGEDDEEAEEGEEEEAEDSEPAEGQRKAAGRDQAKRREQAEGRKEAAGEEATAEEAAGAPAAASAGDSGARRTPAATRWSELHRQPGTPRGGGTPRGTPRGDRAASTATQAAAVGTVEAGVGGGGGGAASGATGTVPCLGLDLEEAQDANDAADGAATRATIGNGPPRGEPSNGIAGSRSGSLAGGALPSP